MSSDIISYTDLIRAVGDLIVRVDVLSTEFDPGVPKRLILDDIRDDLDVFQRKLVRAYFDTTTPQIKSKVYSLSNINSEIKKTISDLDKFTKTLEQLVKFIGVGQELVKLLPVPLSLRSALLL